MSPRDWWERAKEWLAIALGVVLYLGGWVFTGLMLSHLGPWGIVAAGTAFLVDVALLFFAIEWGFGLFGCLLAGTSIWLVWRKWHWWGLALALLAIVLVLVLKRFLGNWPPRRGRRYITETLQDGTYRAASIKSDVKDAPSDFMNAPTKSDVSAVELLELLRLSDLLGLDDAPRMLLGVLASGEFQKRLSIEP